MFRLDGHDTPPRKRQRMSSPTYDEQVNLSQDDIAALDQIEQRCSPTQASPAKATEKKLSAKEKRARAIAEALRGDSVRPGKENINGERVKTRVSSVSPVKDLVFSSQPRFDLQNDNPFNVLDNDGADAKPLPIIYPSFQRASIQPTTKFASAIALPDAFSSSQSQSRSPSPEVPPEHDFSAWFEPVPASVLPPTATLFAPASVVAQNHGLFAAASAKLKPNVAPYDTASDAAPSTFVGFSKANMRFLAPSAAALEKAAKKMKAWHEGDPETDLSMAPSSQPQLPLSTAHIADISVKSPLQVPESPTPAGPISHLDFGLDPAPRNPNMPSTSGASLGTNLNGKPKPFVSPLRKKSGSISYTAFTSSPLNPNRSAGFTSTTSQHPLAATPLNASAFTTSLKSGSGASLPAASTFATPIKSLGVTARNNLRNTPARFTTPFKSGMRPGEAGRISLDNLAREKDIRSSLKAPTPSKHGVEIRPYSKAQGKERWKAFNLDVPQGRQNLANSGLVPQCYDADELEAMRINASELSVITPITAMYYSFHTSSTDPISFDSTSQISSTSTLLGPAAALEQLLQKGCSLATKAWVDNHWAMILWKLAGMVCLDPERESDGREKRWCWREVMRQLLYRYERELNTGTRPPLRKISAQDAPAASPMVLCISNITWLGGGVTADGMPIDPHPELELTDGWYRLRAEVDSSLARAVRKGKVRVGRKIAVAGARLSSERKDPMEILEAYDSTRLVITGNSSHLAPWHAKLGLQSGPFIATLNHLNGDGGVVAVLTIVVVTAYPVAYIESIDNEDGTTDRIGPRNANEEALMNEQWKARRELEAAKLRAKVDKRMDLMDRYADRLERRAGACFKPLQDDLAPDHIDDLYDELEDATKAGKIIASVNNNEAGWLARCIREKVERDREAVGEEIEQELQKSFPPRNVRNFRVLVVRDAYTSKKPAYRQAQLTVWDALSLSHSEGSEGGSFEVGQRFMVTNLVPTQPRAWMDRNNPVSEVYLSTRRDTRWTRLK